MEYFGLPPADIYLMCDSDSFIASLSKKLNLKVNAPYAAPVQKLIPQNTAGILNIKAIADVINSLTNDKNICLIRLPLGWNGGYRDFSHPLDYLGKDGGGGIGSGPGMCVGSALALKGSGRIPIGVIGDGDFLMGVTALWTACHYHIPLLMIIANNNSYFNDEMHQERVAIERDRPIENRWIGMRMSEPDIDLAGMSRAQGAFSIGPITDVTALNIAIAEGLDAVRNGKVCVIDVRVATGYDANLSGQVTRSASGDSRPKT